jgi:hypothetical protein
MLYGEPRLTHDIDLVVLLRQHDIARLLEAYPAPEFYVPPAEVIAAEVAREQRGQFNVIHPESRLKADFHTASRDKLHAWAFRRARHYVFERTTIRLAPPEYVIVRKLEYFREGGSEKHLRDVRPCSRSPVTGSTGRSWTTGSAAGASKQNGRRRGSECSPRI